MQNDTFVLTGMGHQHPKNCIENSFFESLDIESSAKWVEERTGIKARHSVLDKETLQDLRYDRTTIECLRREGKILGIKNLVSEAWEMTKRRSMLAMEELSLLICGTSVPDFDIPANASVIAHQLGLSCFTFDAHSACSSFVTDLAIAKGLLGTSSFTTAAIMNVERYTLSLDFSDRKSCVLFGDGTASSLLEKNTTKSGLKLIDIILHSDPSGYDAVKIPVGAHFSQNGSRVQKFAVSKTCSATLEILEKNGLGVNDINYFIGHQANLRMLNSVCSRLNIEKEKHLFNVEKFGNQGAAGAPAVLSSHWEQLRCGDKIVVTVVGSGLTWGSVLFEKI